MRALPFAVDAAGEAMGGEMRLVLLGAVGGVSPDPARCVGPVEEPDELRAVVTGRIGRAPGPDQPMAPVDAEMVLVAEERDRDVDALRPVRGRQCPSERIGPGHLLHTQCRVRDYAY
jgi:hypothetical protein